MITVEPVTRDNWVAVARLDLLPEQEGLVAANVWSLAAARFDDSYQPRVFLLDGKPVGEPIDCSGEGLAPGGEILLVEMRMMARADHAVSLRSVDGKAIGVDYLRFEKVPAKQQKR